jgi:hypothetical protein
LGDLPLLLATGEVTLTFIVLGLRILLFLLFFDLPELELMEVDRS